MTTTLHHEPVKLAIVKFVHTIIYVTMATATLYIFYSGASRVTEIVC